MSVDAASGLERPPALRRLGRDESVALNLAEFAGRREELSAPPRLLTLGTHNACNAKCGFCLEGRYERFDMRMYREFFEARLGQFIRQAEKVTFTGFGEVLWIPEAAAFLDHLNATIPETWKIFTTNGTPLGPAVRERLLRSKYVIQCSLHAANAALHEEVTGLRGAYRGIVAGLEELCRVRRERGLGERLHVVWVSVVTRRNIDDLAEQVRLAWKLSIPEVQFNYVTMFNEEHIGMSCFFDQQRSNRAIAAAREALEEIRREADPEEFEHFLVRLPEPFGRPRAAAPGAAVCEDPWQHVYVEGQGSVLPCCYWGAHIGDLKKGGELEEIWNGTFYRDLRAGMASGRPHPWCRHCVKLGGSNVDSLLSHLTNRPDQQKRLLDEIERRGLTDVRPYLSQVEEALSCVPR